jgi:hypothetical protein
MNETITIRPANLNDTEAIERLAQLDSKPVPEGNLIVGCVGDDLRAAMSESGGPAIANPFHYTEELLDAIAACAGDDRARIRTRRRGIQTALRLA